MRLTALTFLCWSLLVSPAAAQRNGGLVIVPSHVGDTAGWMEATVSDLRAELVRRGSKVWSHAQAASELETKVSAPAPRLDGRTLRRWISLSDAAVDDLAEANYQRALEKSDAAHTISRESIEELNREPERSRRVFDTCLYKVRALLATQSESRAKAAARECRELVPRGEPSPYMHPPAVTELLDEIDALQTEQTGELRVESTPSGCAARLNGLLLGETPVSIGDLFPAKYRIQVECDAGRRGRVHAVTVGAGTAQHRIDWRFDEVIETRPSLSLGYSTAPDEREHRLRDASRVALEIGADGIVLVSMPTVNTLELERFEIDEAGSPVSVALARLLANGDGPDAFAVRSGAQTLSERRCLDFTSSEPTPLPCAHEELPAVVPVALDERPARRRPRGQFIAGLTLVGVGVAGLTTGYVLLVPRRDAALDWVNEVDSGGQDPSAQQTWLDLRGAIIASASVGSAALVTAMPLALPKAEKTPWWAWVSGGVGLGLAAFSIGWGVTAEAEPASSCSAPDLDSLEVRSCVNRGKRTSVALLTGLTSAPLVTIPLVYLLRPGRARLEPEVEVGRNRAYLVLRGRF